MYVVSFLLHPPLSATEVERVSAGEVKMNVPASLPAIQLRTCSQRPDMTNTAFVTITSEHKQQEVSDNVYHFLVKAKV